MDLSYWIVTFWAWAAIEIKTSGTSSREVRRKDDCIKAPDERRNEYG